MRRKTFLVVLFIVSGFVLASCAGAPVRGMPEEARFLMVESVDFFQTAALFTQGGEKIEIGEKTNEKNLIFGFSEARRDDKFAADVGRAFLKGFSAVLEKNDIRIIPGASNKIRIGMAYAIPTLNGNPVPEMRYLVAQASVFRGTTLIFQKAHLNVAERIVSPKKNAEAELAEEELVEPVAVWSGNMLAKVVAEYFRGDEK